MDGEVYIHETARAFHLTFRGYMTFCRSVLAKAKRGKARSDQRERSIYALLYAGRAENQQKSL